MIVIRDTRYTKPKSKSKALGQRQIEQQLRSLLGNTYGGPALSFEEGMFVIYKWYDAPSGIEIMGKGDSLNDAIFAAYGYKAVKVASTILKKEKRK